MVQRRQEGDARFLLPIVDELDRRQYQLFFVAQEGFHRLAETGEIPVNDDVVRDAARALAATYDTASKGIIYEHRPSSPPAAWLARELKPLLEGKDSRSPVASKRDLVDVLRCVAQAATDARKTLDGGARAYLDLVGRLLRPSSSGTKSSDTTTHGETSDPVRSVIIP